MIRNTSGRPALIVGARHGVLLERQPGPLCRGSLTFSHPSEPTTRVTLEVIVTDDHNGETVAWYDLPEYHEAGWDARGVGPFTVAVRAIGC